MFKKLIFILKHQPLIFYSMVNSLILKGTAHLFPKSMPPEIWLKHLFGVAAKVGIYRHAIYHWDCPPFCTEEHKDA